MARHRLGKRLEIAIRMLARDIPPATGKRHLTIERHSSGTVDKDGLYGGCKPLIDAIKRAGLIVDDSPDHCELEVVQVKIARTETACTVIRLADLPGQ
jgi:hypothetical protein